MKSSIVKAGALVLMGLCIVTAGRAQDQNNNNKKKKGDSSLDQQKPGDAPAVSKDELNAYKAIYAVRAGDPNKIADLGEAFVVKFPDSRIRRRGLFRADHAPTCKRIRPTR